MKYLIPESLDTERLYLRMFRQDDLRDLHEYYSDTECTRYTVGRPLQEYESWQKLAVLAGHWQLRNYGSYALEDKSTNKVLGFAGLDYPHDWPEPEIQWGLIRQYWGMGYASEAVREVKQMTATYLPDMPLISVIHPDNSNSINLAMAVGAKFEKQYFFRECLWNIYRHEIEK